MDVVVIGAGVVGLMTARQLALQGHRVTVTDRDAGQESGCSYGNAGLLVPSHVIPLAAPGVVLQALRWLPDPRSPFRIRPRADLDLARWGLAFVRSANAQHCDRAAPLLRDLHLRSRSLYSELDAESAGAFGLERSGVLMICRTPEGWREEQALATRVADLGVPTEVLDRDALGAAEPDHCIDAAGAVRYPLDCQLDPARLMDFLIGDLERRGAELRFGEPVETLLVRKGEVRAVQTSSGPLQAEQFVLAAGSWSGLLARTAGVRLPMEPGRGYSLTVPARQPALRHPALLSEDRVSVTPFGDRIRVGGTMELVGHRRPPDPRRVEGIVRSFTRVFGDYTPAAFDGTSAWSGHRPCTPDGLPYIGRSRAVDNLLIATGHAMMGISLAPATAELIAREIAAPRRGAIPDLLRPERFSRGCGGKLAARSR